MLLWMPLHAHFDSAIGLPGPQPFVSFKFYTYSTDAQPFIGLLHQVLVHATIADKTVPIGPAYLPGSHRFEPAGSVSRHQVTMVLPVDFATLRWIEEQRSGRGGVTFNFDWNVLGHVDGAGQPLRSATVSLPIGGAPFPVQLPQEDWLKILHDVRYRDVAIVEIPLVDEPGNPLARAHDHLETARERLYRADDRGVLVACGEALDVLLSLRKVRLSKEYGFDALVEDVLGPIFDSQRKAERLGRVLSGVRQMCLSGKHDEASLDTMPIPVDHNDAVLAFVMTSAAISYLEKLPLQEAQSAIAGARARTRRRSRRPRGEVAAPAPKTEVAAPEKEAAPPPTVEAPAPQAEGEAPARPTQARRRRRRAPRPDSSASPQA